MLKAENDTNGGQFTIFAIITKWHSSGDENEK